LIGCSEVHGIPMPMLRCEFSADELISDDSEAYLSSSAFIPQVRLALVVIYNISSPDTAAEVMIVSRFDKQIVQRHSLSQRRTLFATLIPSSIEPMYVVLHAYPGVSTATHSSSSITIMMTILIPFIMSELPILLLYYSRCICC